MTQFREKLHIILTVLIESLLIIIITTLSSPACAEDLISEPWKSTIRKILASEKPDIQRKMLLLSEQEYQDLMRKRRQAEISSNLRDLHWIGTQLNMLAALQGRTQAYYDAIVTFNTALKIDPNFGPAHWGLGFVYYNVTINDLILRGKMVKTPVGLSEPIPDEQGAKLMIQAYREAKTSVMKGYGPSDPNYLEMSLDKLSYYCSGERRQGRYPKLCGEIH